MDQTDYEEWEEIGEEVNRVYHELTGLVETLNGVPKSVWRDGFEKADDGLTELKSVLENRMFEEYPVEAETDVFYGDPEESSNEAVGDDATVIYGIIKENKEADRELRGATRDMINDAAADAGLSPVDIDDALEPLLQRGLVYRPSTDRFRTAE